MSEGGPAPRVIDGRFELEARLGGGGMGTVWRARDLVLDRAVALKEVRPPDPALAEYDPQAAALLRARVLREARALARVDHPNVVTVHHVVDPGKAAYPWLVMELVTGGSLADRLARGPMDPRAAAQLGREVLAALRAAHAAGIQHRDVKPANVLLRPDGRPVLTDFGIAAIRESTALTATGSIIGTPDYMAPERVSGGDGGPESDLWSLAMMLYVAVEGRHPLRRATTLATLAAVLNEELPPPERAGVLAPVLGRILVKDPALRPSPAAVDAQLASAAKAPSAEDVPATSYRLSPPAPPAPSVQDAVPGPGAAARPGGGTDEREARVRRLTRRLAIGTSLTGTAVVATVVWVLLPDGGATDTGGHAPGPSTVASASAAPSAGTRPSSAPGPTPTGRTDLLTPDGIRTALKALEAEAGTSRVSSLTVYPEHVSAQVMVNGSRTRYDSWTYTTERGAEKGIISGSVTSMQSPFDVDDLDWDAVPALLKKAEKTLNVSDVTSRYLDVRAPDPTFGTPLRMAVYLSNAYSESGYIEADARGRVTRTLPDDKS
ncbi:serine/threonine-protein kinase [Streptomyces sp. cg35]|uniref:serine/threonine-protein kinase n=1 Tax=Streptomyces sp. cg35 TaxID=3421650 RepID=UPI003D17E216